jgi:hypothetical protein
MRPSCWSRSRMARSILSPSISGITCSIVSM